QVLLIVNRRADDFRWISHRAEQLQTVERHGRRTVCDCARSTTDFFKIRNKEVVYRKRVAIARQDIQGGGHVAHSGVFHKTQSAVPKPAESHKVSQAVLDRGYSYTSTADGNGTIGRDYWESLQWPAESLHPPSRHP